MFWELPQEHWCKLFLTAATGSVYFQPAEELSFSGCMPDDLWQPHVSSTRNQMNSVFAQDS